MSHPALIFLRALNQAKLQEPNWSGLSEIEQARAVDNVLLEWVRDAAVDREMFGEPEDTPCIEAGVHNCNDYGTGEGQFHGRIG